MSMSIDKRYFLFCGSAYYPGGGWRDFDSEYDELDEARRAGERYLEADSQRWYHVVDIVTGTIAANGRRE